MSKRELIDALRSYSQADEEGVMVFASRQACEEAAAFIETYEWQPIETAPRDGKPILLWKANTREHYVAAWIVGDHPGWCTPDGFEIFGATKWAELLSPPESEA